MDISRRKHIIHLYFPTTIMAEQNFADEADDWAEFEAAPVVNSTVTASNDLTPATDTDPWAQFEAPSSVADDGVNVSLDSKSQQNLLDEHDDWAEFEAAPIHADVTTADESVSPQEQVDIDSWGKIDETLNATPQSLVEDNNTDVISDDKAPLNEHVDNSDSVAADKFFVHDVEVNTKRDMAANDLLKVGDEFVERKEEQDQPSTIGSVSVETAIPIGDTGPIPGAQTELDPFADCDIISADLLPVENTTINFETEETVTKDIDVHTTTDIKLDEVEPVHVSTANADDTIGALERKQDSAISDEKSPPFTPFVDDNTVMSSQPEGNLPSDGKDVLVDTIEPIGAPSFVREAFEGLPHETCMNAEVVVEIETSVTVPVASVETEIFPEKDFATGESVPTNEPVETPDNHVTLNVISSPVSDSLDKGEMKSEDLFSDRESSALTDTSDAPVEQKKLDLDEVPHEIVENELSTSIAAAEVDVLDSNTTVSSENVHLPSISTSVQHETATEIDVSYAEIVSTNVAEVESAPVTQTQDRSEVVQIEDVSDKKEEEFAGHIPTVRSDSSLLEDAENETLSTNNGMLNVPQEKEIDINEENLQDTAINALVDTVENIPTEMEQTETLPAIESDQVHLSDDKPPSGEQVIITTDATSEYDDVVKEPAGCVEAVPFSEPTEDEKEEVFGSEIASRGDNNVADDSLQKDTSDEGKNDEVWDGFESQDISHPMETVTTVLATEPETAAIAFGDDEDDWAGFEGPATSVNEVTAETPAETNNIVVSEVSKKTETKVEEEEDDWDGFETAPNQTTIENTQGVTAIEDTSVFSTVADTVIATEPETAAFGDDDDDWAGFEGPATSVNEVTAETPADKKDGVVSEVVNKTETKVEEEEEDDWDGFETAPSHSDTGVSAVSDGHQTANSEQLATSIVVEASTSVLVPVVSSSIPIKSQEDMTQNEQTLFSLLQQLCSSTTENVPQQENVAGVLLSTVSHWQHFASLLQPNGDKAATVCDDTLLSVLTVPALLRSETSLGRLETQPRHTQTDHVACVASSRATVSRLFEQQQQQQRQQDMDILDDKSLDAQLERLHLLPHQLHLASHFAATPVAASGVSRSVSSSFSFTTATSASVQPVSNKVLVRCGSGWQRKIARLSAVSLSVSHDTHDTHDTSFRGREAMLLNKQVSLTLQQAASSSSSNRPSDHDVSSRNDPFVADKTDDKTDDFPEDTEDDWGGFVDSSPVPATHTDTVHGSNESETALSSSARAMLKQLPDLSFVLAT